MDGQPRRHRKSAVVQRYQRLGRDERTDRHQARYWSLDPDDYDGFVNAEDLEGTLAHLQDLTAFYQKAAQHGWASVFFADQ